MKLKELSRVLGIHENTIRYYLKELDITVKRDERNNRVFDAELVELLKKAQFYINNEGTVAKAKKLLGEEIGGYNKATMGEPVIQIIQESEQQGNFNLTLKPLNDRLIKLESLNTALLEETRELIRENATLIERVKNKDDIIGFKDSLINDKDNALKELKERIHKLENPKWWKFWSA